jgi:hypothetical protein
MHIRSKRKNVPSFYKLHNFDIKHTHTHIYIRVILKKTIIQGY